MNITNAPRDLRYSDKHSKMYEDLKTDASLSPFAGATYKDIFLYAMAYGYRHGLSEDLEKPRPNIPLSVFSEEEQWLIKSIAVSEASSLEILSDEKSVYETAERYANGALETIYAEVFGGKPGEPYKRMMQDIWDELEDRNHD
jgi:dnd system-associated protein 4